MLFHKRRRRRLSAVDKALASIIRQAAHEDDSRKELDTSTSTRHRGCIVVKHGKQAKLYTYYLIDHRERDT